MGALNLKISNGTILYIIKQIATIHIQVFKRVATTIKVTTESLACRSIANARNLYIIKIKIIGKFYLVTEIKIGIVEINWSGNIILDDIRALVYI